MKRLITLFLTILLLSNSHVFSAEKKKFFKPWNTKKNSKVSSTSSTNTKLEKKREKFLKPWGPNKNSKKENAKKTQETDTFKQITLNNNKINNISVYTGTFDTIDKEGDDKTTLVGMEHKNGNLFG